MNGPRFHQIALMAALGLSAGCSAPGWPGDGRSATPPDVLSGVTTPGQAYLREVTIGAADGMRVAGWRDREVWSRVDRARASADLFRFDMSPETAARYDAVRRTGYAQGLSGAWDPDALYGYLDVIEAGTLRFIAIEGAGHSDHAWSTPLQAIVGVTGAGDRPIGPDRFGHEVVATALASEINEVSLQMAGTPDRDDPFLVPAVMAGDRLTGGRGGPAGTLLAYAEVLPPGAGARAVQTDEPGF
jgi:hypothetical protein